MTYTPHTFTRLKIKPANQRDGTFEIKTSSGKSLGFVMNGTGQGPSLVIAGSGIAARSAFQQVLLWPASHTFHGRLAMILVDRITDDEATGALREVSALLAPVTDSLFLPSIGVEKAEASTNTLQTIKNFCNKHSILSARASRLDCASI